MNRMYHWLMFLYYVSDVWVNCFTTRQARMSQPPPCLSHGRTDRQTHAETITPHTHLQPSPSPVHASSSTSMISPTFVTYKASTIGGNYERATSRVNSNQGTASGVDDWQPTDGVTSPMGMTSPLATHIVMSETFSDFSSQTHGFEIQPSSTVLYSPVSTKSLTMNISTHYVDVGEELIKLISIYIFFTNL